MRQLIDKYRDEYDKAVKGIKADIAMKIVSEIASGGGRFLIKDSTGNWWIEVDHSFAQKKVSKAFRSARKPPASSSTTTTDNLTTDRSYSSILKMLSNSEQQQKQKQQGDFGYDDKDSTDDTITTGDVTTMGGGSFLPMSPAPTSATAR